MLDRLKSYLLDLRDRPRISNALTRGMAGMLMRVVDKTDPWSWEFSGFSQNGEDGIIQVLRAHLQRSNKYFLEIGSADGLQNNSTWLAMAEGYDGMMVEGDSSLSDRAHRLITGVAIGVKVVNTFVTRESVGGLMKQLVHNDPDVLSLDIDGNDYYIAKELFDAGLRPKICVVEYNAVFGASRALTVPYSAGFDFRNAHPSALYYGVSISGWRNFFADRGYTFVTVDRHGVNAFFVDPRVFAATFLDQIRGVDFVDNVYQSAKYRMDSAHQFDLIRSGDFVEIARM